MGTYDWVWHSVTGVGAFKFSCGYCDAVVASDRGWDAILGGIPAAGVRICPNCGCATFFDFGAAVQMPGPLVGSTVQHLPEDLEKLYNEARKALGAGAPTSAVLACRKILMHIAVEKGAKVGLKFVEYVEFLQKSGFVPPGGEGWVDHIREKGNEANHEILVMGNSDAENLLTLTEMLLKLVYEFPKRVPAKTK